MGDLYDISAMRKHGVKNLLPWEEQVAAHFSERKTIYIDGNHEHNQTTLFINGKEVKRCDWLAKELHEKPVYDAIIHIDAKGRRILWEHSDRLDGEAFGRMGKALTYLIGDIVYTPIAMTSYVIQHKLDIEKWPLALGIKKHFKGFYNITTGIQDRIWHSADSFKEIDGLGHGHSHFGGFTYTPLGKLIPNPGTLGAECVQAQLIDEEGNRAYIRNLRKQKTKNGLRLIAEVIEENSGYYTVDMGAYIAPKQMRDDNPHMQYVKNTINPNINKIIALPHNFGEPEKPHLERRQGIIHFADCAATLTAGIMSAVSAPFRKMEQATLPEPRSLAGVPVFISPSLEYWIDMAYPKSAARSGHIRATAQLVA